MKWNQLLCRCAVLTLAFAVPMEVYSEAIVIKKSVEANPSLNFIPSGDAALDKEILNMLRYSDWFDIVEKPNADYQLQVAPGSSAASYRLTSNGATVGSGSATSSSPRELAKILVDKVLKDAFKIAPICQTKIAFSGGQRNGNRNIMTIDIDGRDLEQITNFRSLCVEPSFFPDGQSIAYSKYGKSGMDVIETNLVPRRSRRLSSFAGLNTGVAIDPTGRYMALILSKDKQVELYVKTIGSAAMRRLTSDMAVESSPCFSPDGGLICYLSDVSGRPQLYITNLDGSSKRRLPSAGTEALTPDWSSDNKIAYITRVDGDYRIAVLDVATGKNELVPNLTGRWESPSWAPDNRHLVCSKSTNNNESTLYVVDTKTGNVRQLLRTDRYLSTPSWSKVPVK